MASSTARFLLKNGKLFSQILRNPLLVPPNPQVFQSVINPTPHKLYLQRPIFKDGFDFIAFIRGKHSSAFDRMEAARDKKQPVSEEDEAGDEYGSDDEVNSDDDEIEDILGGDEDDDFDEDEDGGGCHRRRT